jgi:hypothetical protein
MSNKHYVKYDTLLKENYITGRTIHIPNWPPFLEKYHYVFIYNKMNNIIFYYF